MGLLSDIKAMKDLQRIKSGGKAKISIAQITNMIVNMPDAQKNLSDNQFKAVYALYQELRKCNTKMEMDIEGYYTTCIDIIKRFDVLAPYEKFSGGNELEFSFMMEDLRKHNQLVQEELFDLVDKYQNEYDIDGFIKGVRENAAGISISYGSAKAFAGVILTENLHGWKKSLETFKCLLDEWIEFETAENMLQTFTEISFLCGLLSNEVYPKKETDALWSEYSQKLKDKAAELLS